MSILESVGQIAKVARSSRASDLQSFSIKYTGPFCNENLGSDGTDHIISYRFFPLLITISTLFFVFLGGSGFLKIGLHHFGGLFS